MKRIQISAAVGLTLTMAALLLKVPAMAQIEAPLVLEMTIPLPDVRGRIDHMALDRGRQRLFVAALGNNTVEVIDIQSGKRIGRIEGLDEPQGVGYLENLDIIVVANAGDGSVRLFKSSDLSPVGRIDLRDDADNIRIDPRNGNILVGYGHGGLAIVDPRERALIRTIPLARHPEGFQVDAATARVFVNVPDAAQIDVVDLDIGRQITSWKVAGLSGNFPIALDSKQALLATVFRNPPTLVLLDTTAGAVKARLPVCGDADDVFFDARRDRIYVRCGGGEIAIFQRNGKSYNLAASVKTSSGARTSLFAPELDRLFVAVRAGLLQSDAAIDVYRPVP